IYSQRTVMRSLPVPRTFSRRCVCLTDVATLKASSRLIVVMEISDRVVVVNEGELVDNQPTKTLLSADLAPYSRGLLNSYREL
ncbi:MAG: hypothetical protein ACR2OU_03895, partial [Thermomicrobiales bacterium]